MSDSSGSSRRRGRLTAGLVLAAVALSALLLPHIPWRLHGAGMMLLVGAGFLVWAVAGRIEGLLIPGCIVLGVGAGTLLRGTYGHGAFLFAMAGGFLLIPLLSLVFFGTKKNTWWALFPAGGLALAGLLVSGGEQLREVIRALGTHWPWAALAVAAYLVISALRSR